MSDKISRISKYKIKGNVIYRLDKEVANIIDNELVINQDCKRYSIYIKECYKSTIGGEKLGVTLKKGKVKMDITFTPKVQKALSLICGVSVPMPCRTNGYRKSGFRNLILKKKNDIMKSNFLSQDEAVMIMELTK